MIRSFKDATTKRIYNEGSLKGISKELLRAAKRKLMILNAAELVQDLRVPPGNRLEKLAGNYQGFYSIRVNDQFRICFRFENGYADDVEFVDYH